MQPSSTGQYVMVGKAIPLAWLVRPGLPGVPTVWKASSTNGSARLASLVLPAPLIRTFVR